MTSTLRYQNSDFCKYSDFNNQRVSTYAKWPFDMKSTLFLTNSSKVYTYVKVAFKSVVTSFCATQRCLDWQALQYVTLFCHTDILAYS